MTTIDTPAPILAATVTTPPAPAAPRPPLTADARWIVAGAALAVVDVLLLAVGVVLL